MGNNWGTDLEDLSRAFHAHLDICQQCRDHPFALCRIGQRILDEGFGVARVAK